VVRKTTLWEAALEAALHLSHRPPITRSPLSCTCRWPQQSCTFGLCFQKFPVADLPQNKKRVALVQIALHSGVLSDHVLWPDF
jgi:hypothetical protein